MRAMLSRIFKKLKRIKCDHSWVISWEHDYRRNVFGEDWCSWSLSSEPTVQICSKCGKVEHYIDVPLEDYFWADRFIVNADWDAYKATQKEES